MTRAIVFAALATLTACGGSNNGPMTYQRPPIEQAAFKSPHPERGPKVPHLVVAQGQSNMARGNDEGGIGHQFVRRLDADNGDRDVIYIEAARGGRHATAFMNGNELALVLDEKMKGQLSADFWLIHQGEANSQGTGAEWIGQWETIADQHEVKGYIDGQTVILFGEVAHGGTPRQAMLPYTAELAESIGGHVVSSAGIELEEDRIHFTAEGRNAMGDRYYETAMEVLGQ